MKELQPLINEISKYPDSHVVMFLEETAIRWRCLPKSACDLIAEIIGNAKVMTKEEFIKVLKKVEK